MTGLPKTVTQNVRIMSVDTAYFMVIHGKEYYSQRNRSLERRIKREDHEKE